MNQAQVLKSLNMKNVMTKTMMNMMTDTMNKNERILIALFLFLITILVCLDVYNDSFEGVASWHIFVELMVAVVAIVGLYFLIKGHFRLRRTLVRERQNSKEMEIEAEKWRNVSRKYLEGLSTEIDHQLNHWNLTEAEKEVTFLVLKGLSDKNIADIRNTSVKTIRTQTNAIYSKSGLSGRSELSGFFLKDLFLPK